MNDETLEYECFGGEYRPKVYDQCMLPDHHIIVLKITQTKSPDQMLLKVNCIVSKSFI